jgi:hypothetical protein
MKFNRFASAGVVAALLIGSNIANAADAPSYDESFRGKAPATFGNIGINTASSEQLFMFTSNFISLVGDQSHTESVTVCTSLSTPGCQTFDRQQARADLALCSSSNQSDCLIGLVVRDAQGKEVSATPISDGVATTSQLFSGDPTVGLPTGGSPTLYSVPAAAHSGGDSYLVKADLVVNREKGQSKFQLGKFEAAIFPVKKVSGTGTPTGAATDVKDYQNISVTAGGGNNNCDMNFFDGKDCYVRQAFPAGFTFELKVRLSQSVSGWLHGRMKGPVITIGDNPAVKEGIDLSIVAEPIRVPTVFAYIPVASAPSKILSRFQGFPRYGTLDCPNSYTYTNCRSEAKLEDINLRHEHIDASDDAIVEIRDWLNVLSDKATVEPSQWSVQTMSGSSGGEIGKCTTDTKTLGGVVTTNATMYSPGPPSFNKSTSSLDYKVVAPHFTHNGDVFLGTYNLAINSKVARCLYGFSNAPISATISISSADGTNRVATTTVTERNGFLNLAAYGFEFSDPTISVKITGQKLTEAAPTPEASPISVAQAKKTTITCIKGKTSKKVAAINPKCPAGYKKK